MGADHHATVRVFDPADDGDLAALERAHAGGEVWQSLDTLARQLAELADTRARRRLPPRERAAAIDEILGGTAPERYGRWVLYPWSGRLVRLLAPDDFSELRLDRNRHKLTASEQRRLRGLTVGVVGLSVGNAVALTLAMEGLFGTLRLADFDTLDLSNLNRLRAGVHELGVPKVVVAARQIAEIDPYADVRIHPDGITAGNVEAFLAADPPVDVLVEECDEFAIKLLLREHARARGIPVLMETSDRGMLDVERFDTEPNRPLLHGLLGELRAADIARLEPEQQLAAMLPMVGASSLSPRLAASMIERGESVSTWPQLASEVTLGGATVAAAVRQLGLGRPLRSGRVYVELEEILGGRRDHERPLPSRPARAAVAARRPPAGSSAAGNGHRSQPCELACFLVEHAIRAPSGGNAQRWRFHFEPESSRLHVLRDGERGATLFERSGHADAIALGAAIENVRVAAAHRGLRANVQLRPDPADPDRAAEISLGPAHGNGDAAAGELFPHIAARATNRHVGSRAPIAASLLGELRAAVEARGARVQLLTADAALSEAAAIAGEADQIRLVNPALHRDAISELRFTVAAAEATRDGLDLRSLELAPFERAIVDITARADVAAVLRDVEGGAALGRGARRALAGASALGLIRVTDPTPSGWLRAGQGFQALWLIATAHGLALQPSTALVYMLDMLGNGTAEAFSSSERERLILLGRRLDALFGEDAQAPAAMLFRLHHAPAPSCASLRRPVDAVLSVAPTGVDLGSREKP
jgi:molybdopterin/thiamine biosynthesis adenylyltransferase